MLLPSVKPSISASVRPSVNRAMDAFSLPYTVDLIYDDEFTTTQSAPVANNTLFDASNIGETKISVSPTDATGASVSSGKFNWNSANGWVMDASQGRSRRAGRLHYVSLDALASGSLQEFQFGLTAESGDLWWALSGLGPAINIKETPGSLRSDDTGAAGGVTQGYNWRAKLALGATYELMLCERDTSGSFTFLKDGADWRIVSVEKSTTLAGKIAARSTATAVRSINRLCTANTSFIPVPLVQHSFAFATGPSDGTGQRETGGGSKAATVNGSVAISASKLQMSADGSGSVIFDTGATEVCVLADLQVYDSSPVGLIVRYVDSANYILVRWNSTANTLAIVEVVNGVETTLTSKDSNDGSPDSYNVATGATAQMQVHIDGNLIRAWYHPGPLHSGYVETTTSRFATATRAGVWVSKGAGVTSSNAANFAVYAQVQPIPEMTNANGTLRASASVPLLLDAFPGAGRAWSLRRLRAAQTNCIRVRRSSDNTEQDIGFDGNLIDVASLVSFCGSGNGFVVTWYDQSGNGAHATQSTQAQQPQIVWNGAVFKMDGLPAIRFTSQRLAFSGLDAAAVSVFAILRVDAVANFGGYINNVGPANGFKIVSREATAWRPLFIPFSGTSEVIANARAVSTGLTPPVARFSDNWQFSPASRFVNGASSTVNTDTLSGWTGGTPHFGSLDYTGAAAGIVRMQELIIYPSDQSANRTGIESNRNSYWAVY